MSSRRLVIKGAGAIVAAAAQLAGCSWMRQSPYEPPRVNVPNALRWDWPQTDAGAPDIRLPALASVLEAAASVPALRALLVVRDGRLVGERYFHGATADDLQPLNSVTKSVASMLVGQALARGALPGLSATIGQLLPEDVKRVSGSDAAAKVTLAQILSGHAGLQYDWLAQFDELESTRDLVAMALRLPVAADPSAWSYNDPIISLISPMLERAEGLGFAEIAERDLFAPLGIKSYSWRRDPLGRTMSHVGLALRPRDLMKLVWTMASAGAWRGQVVVPAEWARQSTRSFGAANWRVAPVSDIGYGYLWFTGLLHGRRVVWGWGYGGQFALWVPSLRLAVVTAAESPPGDQVSIQTAAIMGLVAELVSTAR